MNRIIQCVVFCDWFHLLANVFKVHLCFSMFQDFIPIYGQIIFYCINTPHFVYPFVSRWTFELLPLLAIVHNTAINICVHIFVCMYIFFLLGRYLGVKLLRHMVTLRLNFRGTARLFAKHRFTFSPLVMSVLISPLLHQHLLLSDFLIIAIL